jgi:hypothetical protein
MEFIDIRDVQVEADTDIPLSSCPTTDLLTIIIDIDQD